MYLPDLKNAQRLVERVESTRLVFRVLDDNSYQSYSPSTGFTAETDVIDPSNLNAVKQSVEKRINFYNQDPTPWISTSRRWLWAVWEANRRFNRATRMSHSNPNVRIAIIDLDACLDANEEASVPALGYHFPFIHALSGLSSANKSFRCFADMADEILIYHKVPPSAVISIWQFDNSMSALPSQFIHSLLPSADPEREQGFRSNHKLVVDQFLQCWQKGEFDASKVGESCATVALVLLHDAYTRLAGEVGVMMKSEWKARTPTRRSARIMSHTRESDASANQSSELGEDHLPPFSQTFVESLADKIIDKLVYSTDPICPDTSRDTIENIASKVVMHMPCGTDSRRSTYERFLTHKKPLMVQIMNHIHANGSLIQIRRMRRKVDYLRSVSLELARTVPLGLLDELHITQVDWEMMKCRILGSITAKLVPLYKKLDGLLVEPILRNELVDQADVHHLDAGAEWLNKEVEYPLWWEQCGMQKSIVNHWSDARAWPDEI